MHSDGDIISTTTSASLTIIAYAFPSIQPDEILLLLTVGPLGLLNSCNNLLYIMIWNSMSELPNHMRLRVR